MRKSARNRPSGYFDKYQEVLFHLKKNWLRLCQDFLPSYCQINMHMHGPGLILRVWREGELGGPEGWQSSWWVLSQRIKIVVTLMTRWDWKLTGNDSKASQLSRLKDKNQFWIHCDERRVDAGVIVALAPLFHVFNQPKKFSYLNMLMIWCKCRLRWSKRLSLTSLKFWHPAGWAGLLCHHFDRETRGGVRWAPAAPRYKHTVIIPDTEKWFPLRHPPH